MKIDRPFPRTFTVVAPAFAFLIGCQNATEPSVGSNGPVIAVGAFEGTSLSRVPDSTRWNSKSDSGSPRPSCIGLKCTDTFKLSHPLGTDSIAMQLWTLGIRTTTLYFTENGSSSVLDLNSRSVLRDTLDNLLLSDYYALSKAGKDSISVYGTGSSGLVAYYASLILSGNPAFKGKLLPEGMSSEAVKTALVYWNAKEGRTAAQLAASNLLGLDSSSILASTNILIKEKRLSTADSIVLFPPYPVRVTTKLTVATSLLAGGSSVGVSGVFTWTKGIVISSASIAVHSANPIDSNVTYSLQKPLALSDSVWTLTNNLTLQATSTSDTGTDTLVVTLSDDSGHGATAKALFSVKAAPPATPKLVRLSPSSQTGTVLPFETDSIGAFWRILNWKDVNADSVFIDGAKAAKTTDSTWGRNIYIPPTGQTIIVTFRALGKNDTAASDFVQVSRAKDTLGPAIQWTVPGSAISVDAAVNSYKVQLKATDPSGVDSVYIEGVWANHDSGSYWSSTVALPSPNGKPVVLVAKAWDKYRNPSVDSSVSITRNVPSGADKPVLTLMQPASNTGNKLVFDSTTLHVVYKITDLLALDTTTILFNSTVPNRLNDSTWAADVPVPPTGQSFAIVAQASNAIHNGAVDQLVVTRAKDTIPPKIIRGVGTVSRTVAYDTLAATLSWTVTDNYKLASILLNGVPQSLSGLVITTTSLSTGPNNFVLVATDSFGNVSRDSVVVTRLYNIIIIIHPIPIISNPKVQLARIADFTGSSAGLPTAGNRGSSWPGPRPGRPARSSVAPLPPASGRSTAWRRRLGRLPDRRARRW